MAGIFQDVTLSWRGKEYTVPADRCMRLAYEVEMGLRQDSKLSFFELAVNPPITGLAMAYGAALRFAGARVTDEDVYSAILKVMRGEEAEAVAARELIAQVIDLVMPPSEISEALEAAAEADDAAAGAAKKKCKAAG